MVYLYTSQPAMEEHRNETTIQELKRYYQKA